MAPLTIKVSETTPDKELIGVPSLVYEMEQSGVPIPNTIETVDGSLELTWGTEVPDEQERIRLLMGALLDPNGSWQKEEGTGPLLSTLSADEVMPVWEAGDTHAAEDAARKGTGRVTVRHIGGKEK